MNTADDTQPLLGLDQRSVRLRPYTARWAELYELEARAIRSALGARALDVQHVGSTAVPGMTAKPILDIAVGIATLDEFRLCMAPLAQLGYEHAHWAGLQNNEVFGKGVDRTHLVHVVQHGGPVWNDYLRFRNLLRSQAETARAYQQLKLALSQRYADNRAAYTESKHAFIRGLLDAQPS